MELKKNALVLKQCWNRNGEVLRLRVQQDIHALPDAVLLRWEPANWGPEGPD